MLGARSNFTLKCILGLFTFSNILLTEIRSEYIYSGTLVAYTTCQDDLVKLLEVSHLTGLFAQLENQLLISTITLGPIHEREFLYIMMLVGENLGIFCYSARNWFQIPSQPTR